jgi:hypothetical protein
LTQATSTTATTLTTVAPPAIAPIQSSWNGAAAGAASLTQHASMPAIVKPAEIDACSCCGPEAYVFSPAGTSPSNAQFLIEQVPPQTTPSRVSRKAQFCSVKLRHDAKADTSLSRKKLDFTEHAHLTKSA